MVETVVLDPPAGDGGLLPRRPGDGRGARIGLQAAGVGEPLPVIADLGQDPGAELGAESGEAENDLGVLVLGEGLLDGLGEVVGGGAGGVQLEEQGEPTKELGAPRGPGVVRPGPRHLVPLAAIFRWSARPKDEAYRRARSASVISAAVAVARRPAWTCWSRLIVAASTS